MGSDEKKRRRERFLLDRFLEQQGIKPKSVKSESPPNPDFVVDLDGHLVGIEMTEIFVQPGDTQGAGGLLLQEVESITDQIVCRAREIYFEANDIFVLSKILFSQITRDMRKKEQRGQLAKQIAEKIGDMVSGNSAERVDWKPDVFDNATKPLSEAVAYIHVDRVPQERFAHWTVMRPGLVRNLTLKHVQEPISLKEPKLEGYRKNIEEIWLLMVVDRTRPSQMLRNPNPTFESLSSPFDKTFYYCYGPNDEPVVEVPCRQPNSPRT